MAKEKNSFRKDVKRFFIGLGATVLGAFSIIGIGNHNHTKALPEAIEQNVDDIKEKSNSNKEFKESLNPMNYSQDEVQNQKFEDDVVFTLATNVYDKNKAEALGISVQELYNEDKCLNLEDIEIVSLTDISGWQVGEDELGNITWDKNGFSEEGIETKSDNWLKNVKMIKVKGTDRVVYALGQTGSSNELKEVYVKEVQLPDNTTLEASDFYIEFSDFDKDIIKSHGHENYEAELYGAMGRSWDKAHSQENEGR